jgi:hypothetical protein
MVRASIVGVVACLALFNSARATGQAAHTSHAIIDGEVPSCGEFSQRFGPDFVFALAPMGPVGVCQGWVIQVHLIGDEVNLAEMNEPPHGPSVLDVLAWMFAGDPHRSYRREFDFSPQVKAVHLRAQRGELSDKGRYDTILKVKPFGKGDMRIEQFAVRAANPKHPESGPEAVALRFRVTMSWPSGYTGFVAP